MRPFSRQTSISMTALLSALVLGGCLVGPNYRRPSAPTPTVFKEAAGWAPAHPSDAADRKDWWTVFNDPTLNNLEERVEVSNQNLIGAEAAYRQARALVAEQRAALYPTVSLSAPVNVSHGSSQVTSTVVGGPPQTVSRTTTSYSPGVGASWAPDIWGAVRRAIENARANAQASAADLANARLSAQMEVAADYIALRQYDEQKRLLDLTVAAYAKSLRIATNKYNAGNVGRSDMLSAQAQLESTTAQDVAVTQQRATNEHAIAMLTGVPPAQLTIPAATAWTLKPPQIPGSVPSTLLERRPDISASERLAAAANAEIGVNVAAFYPTLNLTGQVGFQATELSKLFSASNFVWSLGATAAETVFDAGLRGARVAAARAAYDQAVATYRQTVLTAFQQVEDNLVAQRVLGEQEAHLQIASTAADLNERISTNEYLAGQVDYTTVVTAEATALNDRINLLQTQASRLTTAVDLIAALGGGWSATDLPAKH